MAKRKQRRGPPRPAAENPARRRGGSTAPRPLWIYGRHAVAAALANPARSIHRIVCTAPETAAGIDGRAEILARDALEALLPPGAVHQGIAVQAERLPAPALDDILPADGPSRSLILALDQVTDPQNVGAILRTASAFGAGAVIMPERHAPPESGALAKAASGALERIALVRVANLARALQQLAAHGYWRYGLAAGAGAALADIERPDRVVLVLGAEGRGLRRLTAESCDALVHLPMTAEAASLNVAAAAAVAAYLMRPFPDA